MSIALPILPAVEGRMGRTGTELGAGTSLSIHLCKRLHFRPLRVAIRILSSLEVILWASVLRMDFGCCKTHGKDVALDTCMGEGFCLILVSDLCVESLLASLTSLLPSAFCCIFSVLT